MHQSEREIAQLETYLSTYSPHNQAILKQFVRNKQLAGVRTTTIITEILALRPLLDYLGEDTPLDSITKEQVEDWFLWYRDTPIRRTGEKPKKTTVINIVSGIRQVMESIHGEDETAQMFKRIRPVRNRNVIVKEEELLTDEEIERMLSACNGERDRAIIAVLASSGCRVGELCNLSIKDVKPSRERVSLHLSGKTGERDVDIYDGTPEVKKWLAVHPYRDNPDAPFIINKVVRGTGFARITSHGVEKVLNRIAERAGIPADKRHNPHSFRHKRATDLADHLTTADLRVMFGWADMSNTPNVYVHSSHAKVTRKLAELAGAPVTEQKPKTKMVRYCPVCGYANEITQTHCNNCWTPLTETQARAEQLAKEMMSAYLKELEKQNKKENNK